MYNLTQCKDPWWTQKPKHVGSRIKYLLVRRFSINVHICTYMRHNFTSKQTKKSNRINYKLDCNWANIVYLLSCKVCGLQCVGSMVTPFHLQFNNHNSRIITHAKSSKNYRDMDDLIYKHFLFKQTPRHQVNNEWELRDKEGQWAYELGTLAPDGLMLVTFLFSKSQGVCEPLIFILFCALLYSL